MATLEVQRSIQDYWRILWRRKWLLIVPLLGGIGIACWKFMATPKQYTAEALVRREDPVLMRAPLNPERAAENLEAAITRIVNDRSLMGILTGQTYNINYDRIKNIRGGEKDPMWERVLPDVRRRIGIRQRSQSRGGAVQYIGITFTDGHPEVARKVCQAITEEVKTGGESSIAEELTRTKNTYEVDLGILRKQRLVPLREDLRKFQTDRLKDWPKGAPDLARELEGLQGTINTLTAREANARKDIEFLKQQLVTTPQTAVLERGTGRNPRLDEIEKEIRQHQNELRALLLKYTEEYPRVQEVKKLIADLEKEKGGLPNTVETGTREGPNPLWTQISEKLATRNQDLTTLQNELQTAKAAKQAFEDRAGKVLDDFSKLAAMEEDERRLVEEEDRLQKNIEQTDSALRTHENSEGIRYAIVGGGAHVTHVPSRPDPFFYGLMGLLGGITAGAGFVVLAEYTDRSLRTVHDAARILRVPVVGTIGVVRTAAERRWYLIRRLAGVGVLAGVVAASVVVGLSLWRNPRHQQTLRRLWEDPKATIHQLTGARWD